MCYLWFSFFHIFIILFIYEWFLICTAYIFWFSCLIWNDMFFMDAGFLIITHYLGKFMLRHSSIIENVSYSPSLIKYYVCTYILTSAYEIIGCTILMKYYYAVTYPTTILHKHKNGIVCHLACKSYFIYHKKTYSSTFTYHLITSIHWQDLVSDLLSSETSNRHTSYVYNSGIFQNIWCLTLNKFRRWFWGKVWWEYLDAIYFHFN